MRSNNSAGKKPDPTTPRHAERQHAPYSEIDTTAFSRFQIDILAVLGHDGPIYGLAIKDILEHRYGEEVNHGRLYPNLDDLHERGYVSKDELDKRTNQYALTEKGINAIQERAAWTGGAYHEVTDEDDTEIADVADTATASGAHPTAEDD